MFKRLLTKRCIVGAASLWLLGGCVTSAQWADFGRGATSLLASDLVRQLLAAFFPTTA